MILSIYHDLYLYTIMYLIPIIKPKIFHLHDDSIIHNPIMYLIPIIKPKLFHLHDDSIYIILLCI